MKQEYKALIDRYVNGTATGDDLVLINSLIIENEAFRKRFELKKALHAASGLEDEFHYSKKLNNLLNRHAAKRTRIVRVVVGMAASLIIIAGLFYFIKTTTIGEFATNVGYYEVNYEGGTGFSGNPDKNKPVFIRKINILFIANKQQIDTTYQITNTDSLKITLPEITNELKQSNISSLYDYKLKTSLLLINKDTFEIRKSLKVEKLHKYKK